jgi:membrane associated rhomboid family serine protease
MLSDRNYMRDGYGQRNSSVLVWLLSALISGFVLQLVFHGLLGGRAGAAFDRLFALGVDGIRNGHVWTLVSYSFLHDTGPLVLLHLLFNCLGLWFLGRELLPLLGSRRFLWLWFGAVFLGGVLWTATNWRVGGQVIGASAGVAGLLVAYGCIHPNQRMTLLLFFIPVTVVAKYLVLVSVGIDLIGFVFFEVFGGDSPFGWAHSAHLGGMAAGWLYFRYVHTREWQTPDAAPQVELPRWFKKTQSAAVPPAPYKVNLVSRETLRAEVDRILDKINSEGFGALTPEERRRLDEARDLLSKS